MTESVSRICYEELMETYHTGLTTVLRRFRSMEEFEFLETWVPDDDPERSILNILEAAKEGGVSSLVVTLGPETLQGLNLKHLTQEARLLGDPTAEMTQGGVELLVQFQVSLQPSSIHPVYQKKLDSLAQSRRYEGIMEEKEGVIRVVARKGPITLSAWVHPVTHVIEKVLYRGVQSGLERGLLEGLCEILEGRPIQEGSDHAVIRLENRFRDAAPRPVRGIITPENADPAFQFPVALVRGLLSDYRRRTGYRDAQNFFVEPASSSWKDLTDDARLKKLQEAIHRHPVGSCVIAIGLEVGERVVVTFQEGLDVWTKRDELLKLERYLKENVEPILHCYLLPKMDENKPRQAKGVQL